MLQNTYRYAKPKQEGVTSSSTLIYDSANRNSDGSFTNIVANKASIGTLDARIARITDANIIYLMSGEGTITKLRGNQLEYESGNIQSLGSNYINAGTIKASDANLSNITSRNIVAESITTDMLQVNKSAHFFELIIDKINSVNGTQIITAANCNVDYVKAFDSNDDEVADLTDTSNIAYYRIYWRTTGADGKQITNDWKTYDQALCQSFNVATGTSYDVSNKYYWRLVKNTSTSDGPTYVNLQTGEISATQPSNYTIQFQGNFSAYLDGDNINYSNFTIHEQANNTWDPTTNTLTVLSNQLGIQLIPSMENEIAISGGGTSTFSFDTITPAKLNIGVYYDDDTYDYFGNDDTFKTHYSIPLAYSDKAIESIIITSANVVTFEECNWIDLSNTDYDGTGTSAIPSIGDTIVQLGYRYSNIPNPTTDDIARASAIIIAAYRTPDSGVKPPSYAQYQGITNYNLASHRHSYFDATGAHFVGTLEAGTSIAPGTTIPVSIDNYRLIADTNVITQDSQSQVSPSSITLNIIHTTANSSNVISTWTDLNAINFVLTVNGNSYTKPAGQATDDIIVTPITYQNYTITLYDDNYNTMDSVVISAVDISATNGKNGDYTQFAYKNATTQPSTPSSTSTYPPSGWTASATTPSSGQYTWMISRTITYNSSNVEALGNWSTPAQISGEEGETGKDGNSTEFIYYRTTDETDVPDIIVLPNPLIPISNENIEYDDRDHPTRIRKWRHDEYSEWHYADLPDYLPPSSQNGNVLSTSWTDDPQGVDYFFICEFIATRNYDGETQTWGDFSTPALWAKYGADGEQGPAGTDGTDGTDGTNGNYWTLIPLNELMEVKISNVSYNTVDSQNTTDFDNILGVVNTNIQYVIAHIDGDNVTYLDSLYTDNSHLYSLRITPDNTLPANATGGPERGTTASAPWTITGNDITYTSNVQINSSTAKSFNVNLNNFLEVITSSHASVDYLNYYYLCTHENFRNYMPTKIKIELLRTEGANTYVIDERQIDIVFSPDNYFKATKAALNSIYQGLSGKNDTGWSKTGFSSLQQKWDAIQLQVTDITKTEIGEALVSNDKTRYAFMVTGTDTPPSAPPNNTEWRAYESPSLPSYWYSDYVTPNDSYTYLWYTQKSREPQWANSYYAWPDWSGISYTTPKLYQVYDSSLPGNHLSDLTIINSASLEVKSDEIKSTVASTYQVKGNYVTYSSQIYQTAEQISANVYNTINGELNTTGIDITNNHITLNAYNTTINGNLNVHDSTTGLTIYDDDNNPAVVIQKSNVANIYSTSYMPTVSSSLNRYTDVPIPASGASTTITLNNIDLGTFSYTAGNTITLEDLNLVFGAMSRNQFTSINYKFKVAKTSPSWTSTMDVSGTKSWDSILDLISTPITIDCASRLGNTDGHLYLYGQITLNGTAATQNGNTGSVNTAVTFYRDANTTNINQIGLNGAIFKYSENDVNYLANDTSLIMHGQHGIKITNEGAKKIPYHRKQTTDGAIADSKLINDYTWGALGSTDNVRYVYTNRSLQDFSPLVLDTLDEMLVFKGSYGGNIIIRLPACPGKHLWIYNNNTASANVSITFQNTSGSSITTLGTIAVPNNNTLHLMCIGWSNSSTSASGTTTSADWIKVTTI